jgi:tRNA U34 5-methylaminomethyl-2-thiouridine-forming methyltransferase MnmC
MNKRKIKITEDGSATLELLGHNEHFHSTHGAVQESKHIFIDNGLALFNQHKDKLSIFEMGLGTGLNALLTILYAQEYKLQINYFAIEAYPVEKELVEQLHYAEFLNLKEKDIQKLDILHQCEWDTKSTLFPEFIFEKRKSQLENMDFPIDNFDLVYFDAFNPDLQPELWTEVIFRRIYMAMKTNGILMTYSAKGKVKRALKAAGFSIKALPGPPGKREITQAIKA